MMSKIIFTMAFNRLFPLVKGRIKQIRPISSIHNISPSQNSILCITLRNRNGCNNYNINIDNESTLFNVHLSRKFQTSKINLAPSITTSTSSEHPEDNDISILEKTRLIQQQGRLTVAILGPSNAGKSTLFNRLMCKEANKAYRLSSEKKLRRPNRSKV